MERELMAWAVALVGLVCWAYSVMVADVLPKLIGRRVVPTTSPWTLRRPLFLVALGMSIVSTLTLGGESSDANLVMFFVFFNRAVVAGVGLLYAWWITRSLVETWRRRRVHVS